MDWLEVRLVYEILMQLVARLRGFSEVGEIRELLGFRRFGEFRKISGFSVFRPHLLN